MLTIAQTPIFSHEATQKAIRIVKDYVYDLYFPIHDLAVEDIFTYGAALISIESMIYQVDLVAEVAKNQNICESENKHFDTLKIQQYNFISLLKELNFYDSKIAEQLAIGEEYVKLENKIMAAGILEHSEIIRVAELRPCDVRLLHRILFMMLGKPYDEKLFAVLWPIEVIADIENDFKHYTDDVAQKNYNTYRMFVQLYRENASEQIQLELKRYETLFEEKLASFPIDIQQKLVKIFYQFRQTHSSTIPTPILE